MLRVQSLSGNFGEPFAMGAPLFYNNAKELVIIAYGGGRNGSRVQLWKLELQQLSIEPGLTIRVSLFRKGKQVEQDWISVVLAHKYELERAAIG